MAPTNDDDDGNRLNPSLSNSVLMMAAKGTQRTQDGALSIVGGIKQEEEHCDTTQKSNPATNGMKKTTASAANGKGQHQAKTKIPPQNTDEEKIPTRTQLEPSGYYAGWHAKKVEETDGIDSNRITARTSPAPKEGTHEPVSTGHLDESPTIMCDDDNSSATQNNTGNKPPWSTRGLQFTFPRKRRSPGGNRSQSSSTQTSMQLPVLKSFNAQWSLLEKSMFGLKQNINQGHKTSSNTSTSNKSDHNAVKDDSKPPYNNDAHKIKTKNINNKIREGFLSAITEQHFSKKRINIQNDTSVTGRYNTERKYKPFGFVPSTKKACQGEQYEAFQSPVSFCYQYFEDHAINVKGRPAEESASESDTKLIHQHYQSWDPKTMQYTSQPFHTLQPLSQLPLTSSCSATAASRAALLSAMTNAGGDDGSSSAVTNDPDPTPSSSSIMGSGMNDQSINSDTIDETQFRRESGGDTFGRRHSLYMPSTTTSFDTTNNHQYMFNNSPARESSRSAQNLRRTFMGILNQVQNTSRNERARDVSTTEAAEDLFQLNRIDNHNLLRGFDDPWASSGRSTSARNSYSSEHHQYEQSNPNTQMTHSASKKRRKTVTPTAKPKPKKKESSVRRSSRKKSKRSMDGDSPVHFSGDEQII